MMVALVVELNKRRTGDGTLRDNQNTRTAQGPWSPVQSRLEVTEMSRAAGRRPGLSGGQVVSASPLLSLLLLLACFAEACRGKRPPSAFCLLHSSGSRCTGFSALPSLSLLRVSRTHLPLKPWSGSGLQGQPAGEAAGMNCRLRSGS